MIVLHHHSYLPQAERSPSHPDRMSAPTTHTTEMPSNSSTSESVISGLAASSSDYNSGDDDASTTTNGGTKTKTEAETAADKLYEERIEDEYAKREGGA